MRKLNKRETQILAVTVVLAVFFVCYQMVIRPVHEGSQGIDDRIRDDYQRLMKARQLIAEKSKVEARYRTLVELIGTPDSDEAQIPTIVSNIEASAHESNVHIANIQPQKSVAQKQAEFLSVELEVDGQWLDIVHFLYLLQRSPHFYFINEFSLEKYSDTVNSLRGRIVISRMCLINP